MLQFRGTSLWLSIVALCSNYSTNGFTWFGIFLIDNPRRQISPTWRKSQFGRFIFVWSLICSSPCSVRYRVCLRQFTHPVESSQYLDHISQSFSGVIYMKDIRTRALNILGRIKIITSDCQSISSLERNPCKSEEFSICSSWGRRMLIGDIRKTVQVVPETTIPHTEYQFFHLRGPDTFSAGYNYRGDRMLIHWENGVMYSEKDYGSVSAFQRVFSTHLDLFDAKFFGSRQMHVVIGYQKSSMSTGTDTIEVRRLPDPSKPFSGALLVSTLTHPSRNMYEDNREVCANFGLRLYVNPRFPVFAVGSSDGRVFFYRSSLIWEWLPLSGEAQYPT